MKYECICKGTDREDKEPRYSQNWVTAKRAMFKIFDDRVECDDWIIPFENIESAHVYRTKQMFIPGSVLHIITKDGSYQFGFNPWSTPMKHFDLDYTESKVRLGYSKFSIVVRIIIILPLVFLAWNKWM